MDQIAWYLKKDPMEVRVNNFIKKGDIRFPQNDLILSENRIPDIIKEMTSSADLLERQKFVEKFNTVRASSFPRIISFFDKAKDWF